MRLVGVFALVAACGDNHQNPDARPNDALPIDGLVDGLVDGPVDAAPDASLATLAGTGLCDDGPCAQINPGIYAYTPQFPLWADGSTKRRWIYLPPGTKIDTTDMDHWVFPMGTKFWKEFTRNGVRIETRYITKTGPGNTIGDWFYVSYQWNLAGDATTEVPLGASNVNGTTADIPPRYQCQGCHENLQPTRILGFGAIQLDYANATAGELDLDHVIAKGWLTAAPSGASPHYPLPTDSTNPMAQAALGYLHANCGHCHNPTSTVFTSSGVKMELRLTVGSLGSVTTTPPYTTAVGKLAVFPTGGLTTIITKAMPAQSIMIYRFETPYPGADHMPKLGSKVMDPTGDSILRAWITALQ